MYRIFASETGQGSRGGGGDAAAWQSPHDEEGFGGEPADTLRILAGVALDDRATRGELSLTVPVGGEAEAGGATSQAEQEERRKRVPSMRMSSEFVTTQANPQPCQCHTLSLQGYL